MKVHLADQSVNRIPSLDFFRALAILLVLLFHYKELLPFGFLGVDLFFVISGYLVSRQYILAVKSGERADWWSFIVKRGTKILPSFFVFIVGGYFLAKLLFLPEYPDQVLSVTELPPYVFFYLNYVYSHPWVFKLVWSLCIEEHFYLFLTIILVITTTLVAKGGRAKFLLVIIWLIILTAFVLRLVEYREGIANVMTTHVRMDALMLGVLLSYQELISLRIKRNSWLLFALGALMFAVCVVSQAMSDDILVDKVLLYTFTPISFYLMIRGSLYFSFGALGIVRLIAYYSYNGYLWHPIISFYVIYVLKLEFQFGFPLYLALSCIAAFVMTKVIEEPGLLLRKVLLAKNNKRKVTP